LAFDDLSVYSLSIGNTLSSSPFGLLDGGGSAVSNLTIPNLPNISGLVLYATAVTFGPQFFPDVRMVFPDPVEIVVQ